jgi:hypothetical protein
MLSQGQHPPRYRNLQMRPRDSCKSQNLTVEERKLRPGQNPIHHHHHPPPRLRRPHLSLQTRMPRQGQTRVRCQSAGMPRVGEHPTQHPRQSSPAERMPPRGQTRIHRQSQQKPEQGLPPIRCQMLRTRPRGQIPLRILKKPVSQHRLQAERTLRQGQSLQGRSAREEPGVDEIPDLSSTSWLSASDTAAASSDEKAAPGSNTVDVDPA